MDRGTSLCIIRRFYFSRNIFVDIVFFSSILRIEIDGTAAFLTRGFGIVVWLVFC